MAGKKGSQKNPPRPNNSKTTDGQKRPGSKKSDKDKPNSQKRRRTRTPDVDNHLNTQNEERSTDSDTDEESEKSKATDEQCFKLIALVKENTCLWDKDTDNYRKSECQINAWNAIAKEVGLSASICQKKVWKSLRDGVRNRLKSHNKWKSGSSLSENELDDDDPDDRAWMEKLATKWKFWNKLQFLLQRRKEKTLSSMSFTSMHSSDDTGEGVASSDEDVDTSTGQQQQQQQQCQQQQQQQCQQQPSSLIGGVMMDVDKILNSPSTSHDLWNLDQDRFVGNFGISRQVESQGINDLLPPLQNDDLYQVNSQQSLEASGINFNPPPAPQTQSNTTTGMYQQRPSKPSAALATTPKPPLPPIEGKKRQKKNNYGHKESSTQDKNDDPLVDVLRTFISSRSSSNTPVPEDKLKHHGMFVNLDRILAKLDDDVVEELNVEFMTRALDELKKKKQQGTK